MKTLWALALAAMVSSSCTLQSLSQTGTGSGALRMQVSWPEAKNFQVMAIPPDTRSLALEISGSGLSSNLTRRFGRETSRLELNLPVGAKFLTLYAFDAQNVLLASASATVTILPQRQVQAVLELQPVPANPQNPGGGSGGGTTPGNPAAPGEEPAPEMPGSGGGETPDGEPDGTPNPDTPVSTPSPSATPFTSGGGGGGGGGGGTSTGTSPVITTLSASPESLSGLGFMTLLTATVSDPGNLLSAGQIVWSCTDADNQSGCGTFITSDNPREVFWRASMAEANGPYILRAQIQGSSPSSAQVSVTVPNGSSSLELNQGAFDGGKEGL